MGECMIWCSKPQKDNPRMLKVGLKIASDLAVAHVIDTLTQDDNDERTVEQKAFDRRIKIAQTVLGSVCPPAGVAMQALEHGPVFVEKIIRSEAAMEACDAIKGAMGGLSKIVKTSTNRCK